MKSFYAHSLMLALGLMSYTQFSPGMEPIGSAALLPIPSGYEADDSIVRTAYNRRSYQESVPSHSDMPPAPQATPMPLAPENPMPTPAAPVVTGPATSGESPACAAPTPFSADYQNAMRQQSWGAEPCDGSAIGSTCCGIQNRWFISAGALLMGRANQSRHPLTQDYNNYRTILTTADADQDIAGGFETSIGRLLGCNGCNAVQLTYWGLFPADDSARRQGAGYPPLGINAVLGNNLNQLTYDDGTNNYTMQQWMTTTTGVHEVRRTFNYNSFEANYLGNSYAWGLLPYSQMGGCGPRMQFGWLAGFRYFQFNDSTNLYTDQDDTVIDGDANEFVYRNSVRNSMAGFQLGGQANLALNNNWSLYGGGRAGVFNNNIHYVSSIQGQNGYAQIAAGSYAGQNYLVDSTRDALAGIGQIDMGIRYAMSSRFMLNTGYRIVGLAGVATSDGQLGTNFADPGVAAAIRADQSVLLHGGYFGGTFMW